MEDGLRSVDGLMSNTYGQLNLCTEASAEHVVTALSPEAISQQPPIDIGKLDRFEHLKSTVSKPMSGVHTIQYESDVEINTAELRDQEPDEDMVTMDAAEAEPLPITAEDVLSIPESGKTARTVRPRNKRKTKLNWSMYNKKGKGNMGKRQKTDDGEIDTKENENEKEEEEEVEEEEEDEDEEEEAYEVEKILDHRREGDTLLFHVKWKGWPKESSTWEPEENLTNCNKCLKNYKTRLGLVLEDPSSDDIENFKKSLVQPTKGTFENLMKKFSKKGFVKYRVPLEGDIDKKVIELLEVPEDDRDPALVQKVKHGLTVREFHFKRVKQLQDLKQWELEMNYLTKDEPTIIVENEVDLEMAPPNFHYVNHYIPAENVIIPDDPPVGCDCEPACSPDSDACCGDQSGSRFAYGPEMRLAVPIGTPIYECNKRCKCDSNCPNRVVQNGRKVQLCIFRTNNGCGWGVKAVQAIRKGTFVCEYVGEVIVNEEAEKRGRSYDAEGRTYLFDLDYNENEQNPYTVDAAVCGNISHFINHSCEPNLAVYAVWINCLDPNLPRLALFATRNIKNGEEITFDYMCQSLNGNKTPSNKTPSNETKLISEKAFSPFNSPSRSRLTLPKSVNSENTLPDCVVSCEEQISRMACKCGSKKCRRYLF